MNFTPFWGAQWRNGVPHTSADGPCPLVVIGHFAFGTDKIDGQIHRTRLVFEQLEMRLGDRIVRAVDSGFLSTKPLSTIFNLWRALRDASDVIIMPGARGLRWLFPIVLWHKGRNGRRIHYFVVGGWLPSKVATNRLLMRRLQMCNGIYVQTTRMLRELRDFGLANVYLMPNFRDFSLDRETSAGGGLPFRLVFLSRVVPSKGPHMAISAVRRINEASSGPGKVVLLDIYGPIQAGHQKWFAEVMASAGSAVKYLGTLEPEGIPATLKTYDAMVFPTSYLGEGFPGVLLDAMIAGIPVVASDWQDNPEIVDEGRTGLLFRTGDDAMLEDRIRWLVEHPDEVVIMKREAAARAAEFHVDKVLPPALLRMGVLRPEALSGSTLELTKE